MRILSAETLEIRDGLARAQLFQQRQIETNAIEFQFGQHIDERDFQVVVQFPQWWTTLDRGIQLGFQKAAQPPGDIGILTRGVSGIAGKTLIVNFPGSPKSIDQLFGVLAPTLKHVVRTLSGDSSHHESDRTG